MSEQRGSTELVIAEGESEDLSMFGGFGRRKLEKRKRETLSAIRGQQLNFEAMVQRAQIAGDALNETLLASVRGRLKL